MQAIRQRRLDDTNPADIAALEIRLKYEKERFDRAIEEERPKAIARMKEAEAKRRRQVEEQLVQSRQGLKKTTLSITPHPSAQQNPFNS